MASSSTAPSTPENKVRMLTNRSFTLPPKLDVSRSSSPTPEIGAAQSVETLFVHPHTSIIKFSTSRTGFSRTQGLPWTSPTERTVAAGALEIYRVPGSVSFLHSGTLLQPILPRSQCWCVDGISKFVMPVLPDTYYRIELPGETAEELALVEQFKTTLGKVMHYERTTCPFERNSSEELPELEDIRNRRLRPEDNAKWLDRSRLKKTTASPSQRSPMNADSSPQRVVSPALRELVSKARAAPRSVTSPPDLFTKPFSEAMASSSTDLKSFQSIPTDMPPSPPDSSAGLENRELEDTLAAEVAALQMNEALANASERDVHTEEDFDNSVLIHAEDDFDSSVLVQPEGEMDDAVRTQPEEQISAKALTDLQEDVDTTIPVHTHDDSTADPRVATAPAGMVQNIETTSADTQSEQAAPQQASNQEDPFAAIQARILARRSIGGTTSFYPSTVRGSTSCSTSSVSSSSTLSTRSHASQIAQQRNIASALVRKACTVFIGPPAHLVALMLRIAARFANGTFGSMFFVESPSGTNRRIPGSFDMNDDSLDDGISDDEDDFGVPLHSPIRLAAVKTLRERQVRDGWEID